MDNKHLTRFNYLMRKLENLTGDSDLYAEYEKAYMELSDYNLSLLKLCRELSGQINQLERDLYE